MMTREHKELLLKDLSSRLPYDNVVKDVVDTKPQDKMVSLDDVCNWLYNNWKEKISI